MEPDRVTSEPRAKDQPAGDTPRRRPSGAPELPDVLRAPPPGPEAPEPKRLSSLATGLALGTDLLASMAGGLIIGWLVDRWLGVAPIGVLLGLAGGMTLAMLRIIRRSRELNPRRNPTAQGQKAGGSGRRSGGV